jgi:ornithine cyclodeaminase/alanine dehydrogenase-like protein (mu-crystallin family)
MSTLLLTRSDVEQLLDPEALVEPLRAGFVAYSAGPANRALRVHAALDPGAGTATVLFPGTVPALPAYTVKVHAKFPGQTPAIRGVLCLHDVNTGALLAVMDSTYITAVRTGIAGALAAHVLARRDAVNVAVVGAGVQGTFQLRALSRMRMLRDVWVYDLEPDRAVAFAERMAGELGVRIQSASAVADAVRHAGIVLMATWARTPFIERDMLLPGTHLTSLGPDEPGKAEASADVIRASLFVCDDSALAVELGALRGVGLGAEAVAAELGDVLAGRHPGRTSPDEITVYGGVGLAFQDAIAAWHVYEKARARGLARELDFLE